MLDWLLCIERRSLLGRGLLLCALLPVPVTGAPPAEVPETTETAALREALAVERMAAGAEAPSADSREVLVYVGMETDDLVLQEATLTVADRNTVRIELGHRGALALQDGGMLRLRDQWHGVGAAPLRVEVLARQAGAGMSAHMVRVALETEYGQAAEASGLRVALTRDGVFRRYVLQRREWRPAP